MKGVSFCFSTSSRDLIRIKTHPCTGLASLLKDLEVTAIALLLMLGLLVFGFSFIDLASTTYLCMEEAILEAVKSENRSSIDIYETIIESEIKDLNLTFTSTVARILNLGLANISEYLESLQKDPYNSSEIGACRSVCIIYNQTVSRP